MDTLRGEEAGLDGQIEAGNYAVLAAKLGDGVWQHGRRFTRDELLVRLTGRGLDAAPYIAYLQRKYSAEPQGFG